MAGRAYLGTGLGFGGGAFLMHYTASDNAMHAYDGRETAPAAARGELVVGRDTLPDPDVAVAAVNACRQHQGQAALSLAELVEQGVLEYIDFPDALKGKYQSFTEANISALRAAGYAQPMLSVEEGVARYAQGWLAGVGR